MNITVFGNRAFVDKQGFGGGGYNSSTQETNKFCLEQEYNRIPKYVNVDLRLDNKYLLEVF